MPPAQQSDFKFSRMTSGLSDLRVIGIEARECMAQIEAIMARLRRDSDYSLDPYAVANHLQSVCEKLSELFG